jgi:hypothetical protein
VNGKTKGMCDAKQDEVEEEREPEEVVSVK